MQIRKYNREDYSTIQEWFKDWGWQEWPESTFPQTAWIGEYENTPIAFGSVHLGEASLAVLGLFITSKKIENTNAKIVLLSQILDETIKTCKERNIVYIRMCTANETLVKLLEKKGFKNETDNKVYCMNLYTDNSVSFLGE